MVQMVAANGERVSVTTEHKGVKIRARKRYPGCKWQCASMNEMDSVRLNKIGEAA